MDLFSVAGERVAHAAQDGGSGVLSLGGLGLAPGAYVAEFGVWNGRARVRRCQVKVALLH